MKNIIIVGGGAAGLSAAACIAEHGGRAAVLEAGPKMGGNGIFAEVLFALNSGYQAERGVRCDPDGWFRSSMEYSHYKNNARLVRALLEASGENLDWLRAHGLQIAGLQDEGVSAFGAATHHTADMRTGRAVMDILRGFCESNETIALHANARAKHILFEESTGAVAGVEAEANGETVRFSGDAVLLACGGFSGEPALLSRVVPGLDPAAFAHLRGIRRAGDGLKLAEAAGGEILSDGCFESAGPTFAGDQRLMGPATKRYAVWLDAQGRRFTDEAIGEDFARGCNAVYAQPGHFCYVLLDAAMAREAAAGPVDFLAGPQAARGLSGLDEAIQTEAEKGSVCRASDLAGVAAWMNVPAASLEREIAEYNEFCAQGRDPVFLKPKELLRPLREGPYLCIRCGVDYILTHGGVRVDERMRVLRPDGSPVPGLYAAGADVSGTDAGGYQASMGGHSFGFSLTGGRLAAKHALFDKGE